MVFIQEIIYLKQRMGRTYVINLGEYKSILTHRIALYVNDENVTYLDSFGVEHIPKEIRKFIRNTKITMNIYRIQTYDRIMGWYLCIGFYGLVLKGKRLLEYTNLFSSTGYTKKDTITLKYSQ